MPKVSAGNIKLESEIQEQIRRKIVFYKDPNKRWTIAACPSPNLAFEQISFVNGIWCKIQIGLYFCKFIKKIMSSFTCTLLRMRMDLV